MDGLRWLLLLFGLFVVAGVYLYTRQQRKKDADSSPQQDLFAERREPLLGKDGSLREPPPEIPAETPEREETVAPEARAPEEKIVTLRLVARNHGAFAGDELVLSLRGIGMRHGKFGIFHQYDGDDETSVVFSAASLVEPGSFDIQNIKEQEIPGISLFLVLPGPLDGAMAFDLMMTAARALAQTLDGELLDESGSTLSIQRERYLREEIIQHEHSTAVV
jgi:cell division protein ZipA